MGVGMLNIVGARHVKYDWKDLPLGGKVWYSIQWMVQWKYGHFRKTQYFLQGSSKNIKGLKTEVVVSETAVRRGTDVYLQHGTESSN